MERDGEDEGTKSLIPEEFIAWKRIVDIHHETGVAMGSLVALTAGITHRGLAHSRSLLGVGAGGTTPPSLPGASPGLRLSAQELLVASLLEVSQFG